MNTTNKHTLTSKCIYFLKIIFSIIITFLILFFVIGELIFPDERDSVRTDCHIFESDWVQILENGERVSVEIPGKIPAIPGETVTLVTTLPDNLSGGVNICFRTIWQDAHIYVDGVLRQSYSTRGSRPFGTNSAFRYVFVDLNAEDSGKELCYQFTSNSKYAGRMYPSYIGDRVSIWLYLAKAGAVQTTISISLLFLSLLCIIVCAFIRFIYKKQLALRYLAWTVFFAALWMFSEVSFRQLIFKNISVFSSFTYWCLMLISYPLLLYINEIQKSCYEKIYLIPALYSAAIFITGTMLQALDIVQFVEMLPFIHVGNALAIVTIIVTITIDTVKKRISDYLFVGIGIYVLLISAALEIVLYYIGSDIPVSTMMSFGLLFLFIMAIIKTGQDLFYAERKKQRAVAAREAHAKFLANMSHEIRTPINVVVGMNEMILRESHNETVREYANNIQRASNMLLGLVNDVLDFTKIESGQLDLVEDNYSLCSLIQDELLLLTSRIGDKPIATHMDIDSGLPAKLYGDELRIKQVLTNLLSNAVKYTQEGSITLKVFSQPIDKDNLLLSFSVIDTGAGIKEEDLPKLFYSFKRLELAKNRTIEGTGLGLNIAQQLATLMQGTITVESEYGIGSSFTLSIPQKIVDYEPIGSFENAILAYSQENNISAKYFTAPDASVLVVDDNSMNLALMKGLLKRTQMKVDFAASGKECLTLTKKKFYHIILLDHMMPELDGVETLHMLRADKLNPNQNTVVIALTANAVAGCREMYLEYGFHDYFSKPIQANMLDELLIQHLPNALVHMVEENISPSEAPSPLMQQEPSSDLFYIDYDMGLSYCMDSKDFYQEMLSTFCEEYTTELTNLKESFENRNWKQYAIAAHSLKSNTLNIGAANFSALSLQHEQAGKAEDEAFILTNHQDYLVALERLVEKIRGMLSHTI